MWYLYLRRDQHYLRSYRTHNLWLDTYAKKMRQPKISAWHVAVMRKLSKSVSGVSTQLALIFEHSLAHATRANLFWRAKLPIAYLISPF